MDWNTKGERREKKKENLRKMKMSGRETGELYRRSVEKKNKPKRRRKEDY